MKTFVTAQAGKLHYQLPRDPDASRVQDAAFTDLCNTVGDLKKSLEAGLQQGISAAIAPYVPMLKARALGVQNEALPAHLRRQREIAARVPGAFRLPASD